MLLSIMGLYLQLDNIKTTISKIRLSTYLHMLCEGFLLNMENSSHILTANPMRISTKMSAKGFLKVKTWRWLLFFPTKNIGETNAQQHSAGKQTTFGWIIIKLWVVLRIRENCKPSMGEASLQAHSWYGALEKLWIRHRYSWIAG